MTLIVVSFDAAKEEEKRRRGEEERKRRDEVERRRKGKGEETKQEEKRKRLWNGKIRVYKHRRQSADEHRRCTLGIMMFYISIEYKFDI